MKIFYLAICLCCAISSGVAEDRFNRPVIKVDDKGAYQFIKSDDVSYPTLSNDHFIVSCLVYRGKERYYVEVKIKNKTLSALSLPLGFIRFEKEGYTVERTDTMYAARQAALAGGIVFVPTPPPYVPPTYNTTVNATATTYGNQTTVSGTATTTADNSGQAGANLGNAIGNAIAAHRFYKEQRAEVALSHFLAGHAQTSFDTPLQPDETRTIVITYEQQKPKKKPFDVVFQIGPDHFQFKYKE